MSAPGYPFAAIVGQPVLKLALLLASVDWRLSVLLKGDKGSGKSTAARGLADILPAGAPFANLPIGTTEDRLLGGLDLGADADPPTIDLGHDVLVGHLLARWAGPARTLSKDGEL